MTRSTTITAAALLLFVASSLHAEVHMANGIKVGEVDASSAIIWTRLTAHPDRNVQGIAFDSTKNAKQQPRYPDISIMQDSVIGTEGKVKVTYWPAGEESKKRSTTWESVTSENDYTHQFQLKDLEPATAYSLLVEGKNDDANSHLKGGFLSVDVDSKAGNITFKHHRVDGSVRYEESFKN